MPSTHLSELVTRLGRRRPGAGQDTPDADLLGRFVATRDGEAFAELVRRHGPVVFGVCRRVTGDHHLAEDAFQAVFVVLAAKAAVVRPRDAVAAWLHGVAVRTALRARTAAGRRRRREVPTAVLPEPTCPPRAEPDDAIAILDQEIAALPERFRLPVVLCELEGRERAEVAGRLGVPAGTLSSRLAAARKVLAGRLRTRGVVLSAAAFGSVFSRGAAAVPTALTGRAVRAAVDPASVSASVASLSSGVMRTLFLHRLTAAASLASVFAAAALAGALLAGPRPEPALPAPTQPPVVARAQPPAKPAPAVVGPNRLLVYRAGRLTLLDPDGKRAEAVSEDQNEFRPVEARLSPDGKTLAVLIQGEKPNDPDEQPRRKLYVRGLAEKEPGTDLGVECRTFAWSPDGTQLVASEFVDRAPDKGPPEATSFIVTVKTKEKAALKLPANHAVTDWSRDGKHFVTTAPDLKADPPAMSVHLMNRDGSAGKRLTDAKTLAAMGRLSPDGARLVYSVVRPPAKDPPGPARRELAVLDLAAGTSTALKDLPLNGEVLDYCWSPDGKKLAYTWREVHVVKAEEAGEKETESFLVVCDPDGGNAKTIATEKGEGQGRITLAGVDWR